MSSFPLSFTNGTMKKMIDISSASVVHSVVHKVGNRLREEGVRLSSEEVKGNADLHDTLLRHYLAPLAQERLANEFYHESDIGLNAVHQFSQRIFERPLDFVSHTQNVAKHLYSVTNHPSVSGGELISILYKDVRVGDQYLGANATAEILGVLEERNGFSVPDDYQIDAALLRRQAKSVSRQFSIMDGVSLILTLGGVRLQGCGLQKTRTGTRITIDLNVEEK